MSSSPLSSLVGDYSPKGSVPVTMSNASMSNATMSNATMSNTSVPTTHTEVHKHFTKDTYGQPGSTEQIESHHGHDHHHNQSGSSSGHSWAWGLIIFIILVIIIWVILWAVKPTWVQLTDAAGNCCGEIDNGKAFLWAIAIAIIICVIIWLIRAASYATMLC